MKSLVGLSFLLLAGFVMQTPGHTQQYAYPYYYPQQQYYGAPPARQPVPPSYYNYYYRYGRAPYYTHRQYAPRYYRQWDEQNRMLEYERLMRSPLNPESDLEYMMRTF
ncbi:MAG: hypothetical protein V2B18_01100 [Pseudomonadota bacterium]